MPLTRGHGPHVALCGHLDTVRTENGPARIAEGRCHGAGSSDMKSGLAVMIALAETLDLERPPCALTLVFYAKEEGPFAENELGPVLERDPELGTVDLAVCLEPSDNRLQLGCTGSIHATITFEGRTAHSARPWEGENAITKAAAFLAEVGRIAPEEAVIDGLVYRTVTTIMRSMKTSSCTITARPTFIPAPTFRRIAWWCRPRRWCPSPPRSAFPRPPASCSSARPPSLR